MVVVGRDWVWRLTRKGQRHMGTEELWLVPEAAGYLAC